MDTVTPLPFMVVLMTAVPCHDDVIKWKHFLRYWPFVRIIHRSPVNSPHKGHWRGALMFSLICVLNKRLSKQSWGCWFEMPSRSLWRHCNGLNKNLHTNSCEKETWIMFNNYFNANVFIHVEKYVIRRNKCILIWISWCVLQLAVCFL